MTEPAPERGEPGRAAAAMRLRPDRPGVVRLSRKVLAGSVAVSMLAVFGAALWALQNNRTRTSKPDELYTTDHHNVADGLNGLPRDYAGVPPLGPPLPGDLGRPILNAQNAPTTGIPQVSAEQQRRDQEIEAARLSRLFASTNIREAPAAIAQSSPASAAQTVSGQAIQTSQSPEDAFAQNGQDRKLTFVNEPVDRRTTSPDRIEKPASPFVVQAGTIIPGALTTGIRSDLPGQITAQVTENVYDTPTGRTKVIPQGARLIGIYDSQVAFGQSRVLLVWTRLLMPNGRSIVLERQRGADAAGYAGLQDEVDNHWFDLAKAAALSTVLNIGTELGSSGNDSDIIQALRRGTGSSLNQTGQLVVRRNLNIQPTLTIRPGFPVRVIVNRDLLLEPYKG